MGTMKGFDVAVCHPADLTLIDCGSNQDICSLLAELKTAMSRFILIQNTAPKWIAFMKKEQNFIFLLRNV